MSTVTWASYPLSAASPQRRLGLEVRQAVPRQVDQVGGDLVLLRLPRVEPPLTGESDHPDERLGVEPGQLRLVVAALELAGEHVLDLGRDVADHAREGARRGGDRRVTDEDPEAVGVALDVVEQGRGRLLEQLARMVAHKRGRDVVEQAVDLAVD